MDLAARIVAVTLFLVLPLWLVFGLILGSASGGLAVAIGLALIRCWQVWGR